MMRLWGFRRRPKLTEALWRAALNATPHAGRLAPEGRQQLRALTEQFLAAKTFEGAAGVEITDAMRALIALRACVPILHLGLDWYDGWSGIVVYPADFRVHEEYKDEIGVVHRGQADLCGQSIARGPMVLSWEAIEHPPMPDQDLVIHECAHKLNTLNGPADGFPPLPAGVSLADKPRVIQQLERLRKEREAALEQKGAVRQAEQRRTELQQQLKDWKKLVVDAQEALKAAPTPGALKAAEVAVADAERGRKAARDALHQADVAVSRVRGELEGIQRIVAGLGDPQNGQCPFAPGPFRCGVTAAELAAQADAFRKRCETLEAQLKQALQEADQAKAALAAADQTHTDAQRRLGELQIAAQRADGLPAKIAEWKERVEQTAAEIQQLPPEGALADLDRALQDLAERISRGEQILAALEAAERADTAATQLQQEIADTRRRVEALELLVEACSPAGIKADLLARGLADIEGLASGWLQQLLGEDLRCVIQAEPFAIGIQQGEHVTPYHALSGSEQYRVGLVLQAVLSFRAGLGWLVLDGVDLLGPPDRAALVKLLQAFRHAFTSILVTATIGERAPAAPPWPGRG